MFVKNQYYCTYIYIGNYIFTCNNIVIYTAAYHMCDTNLKPGSNDLDLDKNLNSLILCEKIQLFNVATPRKF